MTGIDLYYNDCIVIGDTPRDVRCSKPFGATSIAVSTGPYSYEELLNTGADYVLSDLTNAINLVDELKGH
jgi:phosphoglycolate phosphatase